MPDDANGLGGRLPLLQPAGLDEAARALVATLERTWIPKADAAPFRVKSDDGLYIGPFNPFLYNPLASAAFVAFQMVEAKNSSLDVREREAVILSVGSAWRAAYEIYAHKAAGATAGFSADEITCLASGRPCASLSCKETLAQAVALRLSLERRIDDDLYNAARAAFGDRGLVDIVTLAGSYFLICSLLNAFEIPAPELPVAQGG